MPVVQAMIVAIIVVPTISVGLCDPLAARSATTVVGISVILDVLTAKKLQDRKSTRLNSSHH